MEKSAVLVVSFGTSYKETREKTIDRIVEDFEKEFGQENVYSAYTSQMIINRVQKRDNIKINNVTDALEEIKGKGIQKVYVQPTHILNGQEYEKMLSLIEPFKKDFEEIIVGKPLLTDSEDYDKIVDIMCQEIGEISKDEVVVLMGHGTGHFIDVAYAALDYRFKAKGSHRIYVATVEGYPEINHIAKSIAMTKAKKIRMLPFMIVAGDHATNDMAGDEDSWKTMMEDAGYQVECILKGMGEYPKVREMYVDHLKAAITEN